MIPSRLFIDRPVATTLLTLGICLGGLFAFFKLPSAPLPQIDFPTLSVQASLPGANPETMAATVAAPLERTLGRIAGVSEMTSSSASGSTGITLQFDLNRDIDGAARDVQAAINAAGNLLPSNLPSRPSYRKINPADAPIMIIALTSATLSRGQIYDAASTNLAQKLSQIPGVGLVSVGGSSLPAVRIELNPNAMSHYNISFEDIREAIANATAKRPKGIVDDSNHQWQIDANDELRHAADYLPLIVAYRNAAAVRIADIGSAIDSIENVNTTGLQDGKPAILMIIRKQPNANIIATVDTIKALLPELQAAIPRSIDIAVVMDRAVTVRASLGEVEYSLVIATVLVILVVFLFVREPRSVLIPAVTVPVSLLGAIGVMYLFGYCLNNLSLMALTVATGFVVDDTIVVLENSARHIENGQSPRDAAMKGAAEVQFTVLSMSLSLIAVFIPILLLGGIVGRLFREFAVTLSAAVLVSLLISLTTTPMLCARWLGSASKQTKGRFYVLSERFFDFLVKGYERSLRWALRHSAGVLFVLAFTVALNVFLFIIVPKGFFPTQDNGRLVGSIQGDQSISPAAMGQKLTDFVKIVGSDPDIANVVAFSGGDRISNVGVMYAVMKPPEERGASIGDIMKRLRKRLALEPGARLFLQPVQDLRIGARTSTALIEYTLQSDNLKDLRTWTPLIVNTLAKHSELVDINSDQQDAAHQAELVIDKAAASRLGISTAAVDNMLSSAFGQRQVAVIYAPLNQYHVVMEVADVYRANPDILKSLQIIAPPSAQFPLGNPIPLAAFAAFKHGNTALTVNHQGLFASATISFNLKPGASLSSATRKIEDTVKRLNMPDTIHGSFQGTAKAFQESLRNQPWLILGALLTLYIILGVLYESYIHPITILSTLPSAGVGAVLALLACKTEFSIVALIGVILLIGIVKKNAIMMIDFALAAERKFKMSTQDAIFTACLLRFRPILMTTFAALFGALPLALGSGYGAELRQPLGITIVGGLLVSQVLTLYTTPVMYLYLDRFRLWCLNLRRGKTPETF